MSTDGIIYSLRMHGLLRKLEGLNRWTEYEYARSIMLSPDGKLFTIDDVDNLRQIIAPRSSLVLDTDVTSAVMAADGTILHVRGHSRITSVASWRKESDRTRHRRPVLSSGTQRHVVRAE